MPNKNWTKFIIGIFSLIILCASLITGKSIDTDGYKWITTASSAVILITLAFDKWVWRWPIFSLISERSGHPILFGTWKGKIDYDKDAKGNPGSTDCYMSIYQTFSTIQVRAYFTTSQSHSITATIDSPRATQTRLVYAYHGEAPHGKKESNIPSDGTAILNIIGTPTRSIEGSYFTDRGGTGRLTLLERSKKLSQSYEEAKSRFE